MISDIFHLLSSKDVFLKISSISLFDFKYSKIINISTEIIFEKYE